LSGTEPIIELYRPGGFGDLLMMTAPFKILKMMNFRVRYICASYYAPILEDNPYVDQLVTLPNDHSLIAEEAYRYAEELTGEKALKSYALTYPSWWDNPGVTTQRIEQHLIADFCRQIDVPYYMDELSVHLTQEMLDWGSQYADCVLIQTKTAWSPYKNWSLDRWEELSELIRSQLGLEVFQLGHVHDPEVPGVPKIVAPSIRHAIAAVQSCRLLIGLDSVFNHASKAVQKPSIILWGSTNPTAFGYAQNINLVNGVAWTPAMGNGAPLLQCQPCYREYKHLDASPKLACPYIVPPVKGDLPAHAHPDSGMHACMAANTVPIVFHHAAKLLKD